MGSAHLLLPCAAFLLSVRGCSQIEGRVSLWKSFVPGTSVGLRLTKPVCPFHSNYKCKCCRCRSAATLLCC